MLAVTFLTNDGRRCSADSIGNGTAYVTWPLDPAVVYGIEVQLAGYGPKELLLAAGKIVAHSDVITAHYDEHCRACDGAGTLVAAIKRRLEGKWTPAN